MVTLKDVAEEVGLTVTTVSRVLNNRGYIKKETKQKVYDAMKKLNYQPNEVARSLSKKVTNTIGVIVPHISHPYFAELISSIESAAYQKNRKILLFNSKERDEKEMEYLDICLGNRVAGVILCSGTVAETELAGIGVPIVTIERFLETADAAVECDNKLGGKLAAEHLIQKGCKCLLHFSGVRGTRMPADDREKGFIEEAKKHHVEYQVVSTDSVQYNSLEYHDIIEQSLKKYPKTDGIFASSDLIAAQILQVCSKRNIQIPKQMKVVGFDDVNIAALTTPRITTIHQPLQEIAEAAVELLLNIGQNQEMDVKKVFPVSLIQRETT